MVALFGVAACSVNEYGAPVYDPGPVDPVTSCFAFCKANGCSDGCTYEKADGSVISFAWESFANEADCQRQERVATSGSSCTLPGAAATAWFRCCCGS